jgi:iron complex outermembrane receptor protein
MYRKLLLVSAATCAFAIPAAASAQGQVQEVIVTARKRQESALKVPVVETALPAEQLDRVQVKDLKDIAKLVPGLNLAQNTGALGTQVSLRGVGTSAINAGIDASIALNVDGLQITQGVAYGSALFDVGQVEVLKGPQALFFGKNSPGGVIAVRTADPTDRFELSARYGHEFQAQQARTEVIVSGPITEGLLARLSGLYD